MAYTNSSLVSHTRISPNRTPNRNHEIDTITIHCVVGQCSVETLGSVFADSSRDASSNYGIGYDGRIGMYVEEKDRSWCSSNAANDHRAITIEVASDTYHPYAVNSKAYNALIELLVDICKRNNIKELKWKADKSLIGQVDKQNMTVHRWFENKSCPGDYLYNRHGQIADAVNAKLGASKAPTSPSTPATSNNDLKFKVGDIVNFTGNKHYASANIANGATVKASKVKITAVSKSGKHPYHVRSVNDNGAFINGVYGWVDASDISEIKATTATTSKIDTVKEVQKWANTNYKSGLLVDGIYGSVTKKALVKILQTEINHTYNKNIIVDGIFGSQTKAACPDLGKGDNNDVVSALQAFLVCNGYANAYIDGDYGSLTYESVKAYQRKNGLTPDGIAGKYTFTKLCG